MDTIVEIEGGQVLANIEERTITGRLIPFGEEGRTNLGRFTVEAGDIQLPEDPMVLGINLDHKPHLNRGHGITVWQQEDGVYATWQIAQGTAGDQVLAEATSPTGVRNRLSGEFGPVVLRGGKIANGPVPLWGSSLVGAGAFPSAMVLAADTPDDEPAPAGPATTEATPAATTEGESTVTTTTATGAEPTVTAPATAPEAQVLAAQPAAIPAHMIPATGASSTAAAPRSTDVDLRQVFAAMHAVKNSTDYLSEDAAQVLAEFSDITYDAAGGLTTAGSGVLAPAWVGKLWQGRRYTRKFIDLATHLYGGIALGGRKGFTIDQGTALVQHWAGKKTDLPSGIASTATKASVLQKYGYGADIAREWEDLEGGADVLQAFWEGVVESYALITDMDALDDIFTVAAGAALARLITPEVYPTDYPEAMGMLIQGIDKVEDDGDVPSFAIVNPAARKQMRYTPKDLIPEFVTFTVAPEGAGTADGRVQVVTAPDSAFVGLDPAEPAVIVGAKNGIEFREQGQTPIQIDAVDIARGGLDRALVGYLETFVVRPESYALIGTAAA